MLPTVQVPVLIPMPTFIGRYAAPAAFASAIRSAFIRSSEAIMPSAAAQADRAWSGWARGAFQKAMTASPMNLSMVPPRSRIAFERLREQPVHQLRQRRRVAPVALGDRREPPHVAEKEREFPRLAAERQPLLRLGQLVHQIAGDVLAEGRADAPPPPLLAQVVGGGHEDHRHQPREHREARSTSSRCV